MIGCRTNFAPPGVLKALVAALSMSSGSSPRVGKRCRSRAHFVRVEEIVEGASPKVVMGADGEFGVAIREHPVPNSDVRRQ